MADSLPDRNSDGTFKPTTEGSGSSGGSDNIERNADGTFASGKHAGSRSSGLSGSSGSSEGTDRNADGTQTIRGVVHESCGLTFSRHLHKGQ